MACLSTSELIRSIYRYSLFTPIHSLWCAYMAELFNLREAPTGNAMYEPPTHLPASTTMHGKLVKADLHGAIVTGTSLIDFVDY